MTDNNVALDFDSIELAFDVANCGESLNEVYLDRRTGESLFFTSDASDEVPDDLDDSTRYVLIPDRRELGLGSNLVFEFARKVAPSLLDEVHAAFRRRGGYRRFRHLLNQHDLVDSWHAFEATREREAIVQWCEENNVRYTMRK